MAKGPPKYCLVQGDSCICGRNGWAIKFCRKPLSSERMAEIMQKLRTEVKTDAAQSADAQPRPGSV